MQIYLSREGITTADVWKAATAAKMYTENETTRRGRHGHDTISFNGFGGDEIHSARRPNTRDDWTRRNYYAATWDQWGVLLGLLFQMDPDMKVGGYKRPYYDGADDFHLATDGRFRNVTELGDLPDFHGDHTFRFGGCTKCSASRDWGLHCDPQAVVLCHRSE